MSTKIRRRYLLIIFIVMGFTSMISQIVLLRELVIFFTGNELTLGIILAFWLLWTAIGSGLLGRLVKYFKYPVNLFIICQFLLIVLLPITIVFIRCGKLIFSIPFGEITAPIFILIIPLIALAPIGSIVGFMYTLGCALLSQTKQQQDSVAPGRVYLFEAIGSGIAGFVASVILFRFLENFQIVTVICIINLVVTFFLWIIIKREQYRRLIFGATFLITIVFFLFPKLNEFSNKKMWGILQLLRSETTIYGNIAVTGLGESISFYENGVLSFTHPDLMSAEESVHFALLEHPEPKNVLLIGGDAAGCLPQVLYHPSISKIDLVLLDPASIRLAQQFLPAMTEILQDNRIKIWYQDGRLFLNKTETKYDVIIVNLPDPQTALINRFYTLEFYQSTKKHLAENGILSFTITSSENVLSAEQAVLLNCLYRTMSQYFKDIVLIPGNVIHFIGCLSPNVLTDDPQVLVQRLQQRKLPTLYVREYYIPYRMTPDRMDYVNERVKQSQLKIFNYDFRPIGYFYSVMLWFSHFNVDLKFILKFLEQWSIITIIAVIIVIIFPILVWFQFATIKQQYHKPILLLAIMAIGFSEISLEVLIILGFQSIYGYAYYQLALIMSGFMIGLMLGSWYSLRTIEKMKTPFKNFIFFQILLTGYPLLTIVVLTSLTQINMTALAIQIVFLLLIAGSGFIGGYQFPLANYLIFQSHKSIERVGGMLYAADLSGSVIGAFITSVLLIPILGLGYTCIVLSLINLGVLALLLFNKIAASNQN